MLKACKGLGIRDKFGGQDGVKLDIAQAEKAPNIPLALQPKTMPASGGAGGLNTDQIEYKSLNTQSH
jgi:hypothetical protein